MIFITKRSVLDFCFVMFVVACFSTKQSFAVTYNNGKCSNLAQSLVQGCNVDSDCTKITCSLRFVKKDITLTLDIDKCSDPVTVTARVQVPDLGIDWSHKYSSDDIVAVPGFTVNLPGMSAGVYVQVQLKSDSGKLNTKVKLLAGVKLFGHSSYPVKTTIIDGDLPIDTSDCGAFGWWNRLGIVLKIVIPVAALVVVIVVVLIVACLCCPKQRRPNVNQLVAIVPVTQPNQSTMTTANNGVPMQPLA